MKTLTYLLLLIFAQAGAAQLNVGIHPYTSYTDGTMRVFDGQKLLFQASSPGINAITESKFSPDGRWLLNIAEGNGYVQLWNVKKGIRVKTFLASSPRLVKAEFTPDSQRLLLNFWDKSTLPAPPEDYGYGSSLWSLRPLQRIARLSDREGQFAYTGNVYFDAAGARMITASYRSYEGQAASVWNAHTGKLMTTFKRLTYSNSGHGVGTQDARLSPDGRRVLVLYVDGRLAEYDVKSAKLLKVRGKLTDYQKQLDRFAQTGH